MEAAPPTQEHQDHKSPPGPDRLAAGLTRLLQLQGRTGTANTADTTATPGTTWQCFATVISGHRSSTFDPG